MEGFVKLVVTSYRLGEMSGGFGETGFLNIPFEGGPFYWPSKFTIMLLFCATI